MAEREFDLPELVRAKLATAGAVGDQWSASLPHLVNDLEHRWDLRVGDVLDGGSTAFVASAQRTDGTPAVLKIAVPGQPIDEQVEALVRADGLGHVQVLEVDLPRQALLLERLGPSLAESGLPPEEQVDILCATLHRAWQVPRAPGREVRPEQEKAAALGRYVIDAWHQLGQPCPAAVIERAVTCAERRAADFDLASSVVVHGDPHPGNCLQALTARAGAESGFVLVDPDGFLADRGYDLGVVLRDWRPQLREDPGLLPRLCRRMAERTGVAPEVIWEWGLLERVSTGLYLMEFGSRAQGGAFLASAAMLDLRPS
ncbi:MAG TPA: phosphotransferase [Candidatus Avipropionibacterium avicola]|uniref:Phosphotransferase n=1 Tax=Candidatus Avipropionibacterium avicola TaxID=2840701 RepID=A0A9D1KM16_9ACTN|nr:phosphotransferase [Candidatus Avipropionibacterium avicola]